MTRIRGVFTHNALYKSTFYYYYYYPMCIPYVEFRELSEDLIRTRGNTYKVKLIQHHCYYDLRKFNFTNRVIPTWNSLSDYVVSAETVNTF